MAGRPPKPTALKVLQGNAGHRPIFPDVLRPPDGKVCAPAWLSAQARKLWNELAPIYEAMGCLTTADVAMFGNWMEAQAKLVLTIAAGEPVSNDTLRITQSYAVQFGATPSARARVHVPKPQTPGKLSGYTDAKQA